MTQTPRKPAKVVDTDELRHHQKANHDLIPLHCWDYVDGKGKERGKSPRDNDWRRKAYSDEDKEKAIKQGANVGVRLRADQLVIDVDPRNFKRDGKEVPQDEKEAYLDDFAWDYGLSLDDYPKVVTGSGGYHFYLKKPADLQLRESIEEWPGVELKSIGRQVVAAGSKHPNGNHYYLDELSLPFSAAPLLPDGLVASFAKPISDARPEPDEGAQSAEFIARVLELFDPTDFSDHDTWLQFMMECHATSGGTAREQFIQWSWSDPTYDGDESVCSRWDSLDNERQERRGWGSLRRRLIDLANRLDEKGEDGSIARELARGANGITNDFADAGEPEQDPSASGIEDWAWVGELDRFVNTKDTRSKWKSDQWERHFKWTWQRMKGENDPKSASDAARAGLVRCQMDKTDMYIDWGGYIGEDIYDQKEYWKNISLSVGDTSILNQRWKISSDRQTTFSPYWAGNLLRKMAENQHIRVETNTYDHGLVTVTFSTSDLGEALKPLAKSCGWKL